MKVMTGWEKINMPLLETIQIPNNNFEMLKFQPQEDISKVEG